MKRVIKTVAIVGFSLSTMVVGLTAVRTAAEPQRVIAAPSADVLEMRDDSIEGWPAPSAPFDETVITPVESAGAPMFP